MTYGMSIDLEKCVGCQSCTVACKESNGTPPGVLRAHVQRDTQGEYPNIKRTIVPVLCNHCDNPPCVEVCPQEGATWKREEDGIVVVDKDVCIGCKLCITACPYGARYFIEQDIPYYFGDEKTAYEEKAYATKVGGTVDKCDFCLSRTPEGEQPKPACVQACQPEARWFGEIAEVEAKAAERDGFVLLPEENTAPQVHYLPLVPPKV